MKDIFSNILGVDMYMGFEMEELRDKIPLEGCYLRKIRLTGCKISSMENPSQHIRI